MLSGQPEVHLPPGRSLLRPRQMAAKLGISLALLWSRVAEGQIPKPIKPFGAKISVWPSDVADEIVANLIATAERDAEESSGASIAPIKRGPGRPRGSRNKPHATVVSELAEATR